MLNRRTILTAFLTMLVTKAQESPWIVSVFKEKFPFICPDEKDQRHYDRKISRDLDGNCYKTPITGGSIVSFNLNEISKMEFVLKGETKTFTRDEIWKILKGETT